MAGLEKTPGLPHGALQVQGLDVLPVLFKKGYQEIDGQHGVGEELVLSHLNMADRNPQAEHFLELKLDGRFKIRDFCRQVIGVGDGRRELARLGKTGPEQTRDLLNQGLRRQESIVLLGQLLDQFLVLVELLQIVDTHVLKFNLLGAINVRGVGQNANSHSGTGDIGQLDCAAETLVPLRVIVLQADLEFYSLHELPLLLPI